MKFKIIALFALFVSGLAGAMSPARPAPITQNFEVACTVQIWVATSQARADGRYDYVGTQHAEGSATLTRRSIDEFNAVDFSNKISWRWGSRSNGRVRRTSLPGSPKITQAYASFTGDDATGALESYGTTFAMEAKLASRSVRLEGWSSANAGVTSGRAVTDAVDADKLYRYTLDWDCAQKR